MLGLLLHYIKKGGSVLTQKTVVAIDRNVLILIRRVLEKKSLCNISKKRVSEISKFDTEDRIVTALFSSFEGGVGAVESNNQAGKTALDEACLITKFFKRAKTDFNFFNTNAGEFAKVASIQNSKMDIYYDFLRSVFPIVADKKTLVNAKKSTEKVLDLAEDNKLPAVDIVVVCVLAILYNNEFARAIIKPKDYSGKPELFKKAMYNALSDLLTYKRYLILIAACECGYVGPSRRYKYRYFSFDNGLVKFFSLINLEKIEIVERVGEQIIKPTIWFAPEMFPLLGENGAVALIERLKTRSEICGY